MTYLVVGAPAKPSAGRDERTVSPAALAAASTCPVATSIAMVWELPSGVIHPGWTQTSLSYGIREVRRLFPGWPGGTPPLLLQNIQNKNLTRKILKAAQLD